MSPQSAPHTALVEQRVRTLQIITLALVMGVLTFFAVVLVIRPPGAGRGGEAPAAAPPEIREPAGGNSLSLVAVVVLAATLGTSAVVPQLLARGQLQQSAAAPPPNTGAAPDTSPAQDALTKLLLAYQTQHIVRSALVEGPAFLGLVAYLVEGHVWVLAVPAVSLALLAASLPTVSRTLAWLSRQTQFGDTKV